MELEKIKKILKIKTRETYKYDRKPGKGGGVEPFENF